MAASGTIGYCAAAGGRLMNYDEFFADAIGCLWHERRYRMFADLERIAGRFPPRDLAFTASRGRPDLAGNVKEADLLRMRGVERMNRLGGRLQQDRAALFRKIRLSVRREMHIAHLTRAKN